jgi:hypothetical protein
MVHTVITPGQTNVSFQIPENYIGKRVEITCLAVDDLPKNEISQFGKMIGSYKGKIKEIGNVWDF